MADLIRNLPKDPHATLDYIFDWLAWLNGDTINASTWTVPAGITKVSDSFTSATTIIWLSGGTIKTTYLITNHITTTGGRQEDRSFTLSVKER